MDNPPSPSPPTQGSTTIAPGVLVTIARLTAPIQTFAKAAVVDLRVISHGFNHVVGEVIGQTEFKTEIAFDTQQAFDLGIDGVGFLVVNIGRINAVFFRRNGGIDRPLDNVKPLVIAMAHDRSEGFLGKGQVQDDVVLGIRERALGHG